MMLGKQRSRATAQYPQAVMMGTPSNGKHQKGGGNEHIDGSMSRSNDTTSATISNALSSSRALAETIDSLRSRSKGVISPTSISSAGSTSHRLGLATSASQLPPISPTSSSAVPVMNIVGRNDIPVVRGERVVDKRQPSSSEYHRALVRVSEKRESPSPPSSPSVAVSDITLSPGPKKMGSESMSPNTYRERDFDSNSTDLFRLIYEKRWKEAASRTQRASFEASTWVSRWNREGKLQWRLLPLHAAIVFSAPKVTVEAILSSYPQAAKCKDDRGKLPIHFAMNGVSESIVSLLLAVYPLSVGERDSKGRTPMDLAKTSTSPSRDAFIRALKSVPVSAVGSGSGPILTSSPETHSISNSISSTQRQLKNRREYKSGGDSAHGATASTAASTASSVEATTPGSISSAPSKRSIAKKLLKDSNTDSDVQAILAHAEAAAKIDSSKGKILTNIYSSKVDLESRMRELERDLDKMTSEAKRNHHKYVDAQKQLEKERQDSKKLVESLEASYVQCQSHASNLEARLLKLERELQEMTKKAAKYEDKYEESLEVAENESKDLHAHIEELEGECSKSKAQMAVLEVQLNNINENQEDNLLSHVPFPLATRVTELETKLAEAVASNADQAAKIKSIEREKADLKEMADRAEDFEQKFFDLLQKSGEEKKISTEKMKRLEIEHASSMAKTAVFEDHLNSTLNGSQQNKTQDVADHMSNLEGKLAQQVATISDNVEKIDSLESENEKLMSFISSLPNRISDFGHQQHHAEESAATPTTARVSDEGDTNPATSENADKYTPKASYTNDNKKTSNVSAKTRIDDNTVFLEEFLNDVSKRLERRVAPLLKKNQQSEGSFPTNDQNNVVRNNEESHPLYIQAHSTKGSKQDDIRNIGGKSQVSIGSGSNGIAIRRINNPNKNENRVVTSVTAASGTIRGADQKAVEALPSPEGRAMILVEDLGGGELIYKSVPTSEKKQVVKAAATSGDGGSRTQSSFNGGSTVDARVAPSTTPTAAVNSSFDKDRRRLQSGDSTLTGSDNDESSLKSRASSSFSGASSIGSTSEDEDVDIMDESGEDEDESDEDGSHSTSFSQFDDFNDSSKLGTFELGGNESTDGDDDDDRESWVSSENENAEDSATDIVVARSKPKHASTWFSFMGQ